MEHFESLRNGINNPPMSQQSDTTADTNDMTNLRQVIPGSQQQPGSLSQLSERSDDINDAMMFSQTSNNNDDNLSQEDRNARRLRWAEKGERSEAAAESNNPIEKMHAAAWSKVEDAPTPNPNPSNTSNTNNNNNSTTPSWADRISGVTTDVLVGTNNTTTTNTTATGDLGDLAKSPSQKQNIQNVNNKMSSLLDNNSPALGNSGSGRKDEEEGDLLSPTNWASINSSEEQSTNIPPRWAMSRDNKTNDDLYGPGGLLYDNSSRHVGDEAWMNDINSDINSRENDIIDPSNPPGRDKMLSMFDNTANDDNSSSTSSGLPGDDKGDNLVSTEKDGKVF